MLSNERPFFSPFSESASGQHTHTHTHYLHLIYSPICLLLCFANMPSHILLLLLTTLEYSNQIDYYSVPYFYILSVHNIHKHLPVGRRSPRRRRVACGEVPPHPRFAYSFWFTVLPSELTAEDTCLQNHKSGSSCFQKCVWSVWHWLSNGGAVKGREKEEEEEGDLSISVWRTQIVIYRFRSSPITSNRVIKIVFSFVQ